MPGAVRVPLVDDPHLPEVLLRQRGVGAGVAAHLLPMVERGVRGERRVRGLETPGGQRRLDTSWATWH